MDGYHVRVAHVLVEQWSAVGPIRFEIAIHAALPREVSQRVGESDDRRTLGVIGEYVANHVDTIRKDCCSEGKDPRCSASER